MICVGDDIIVYQEDEYFKKCKGLIQRGSSTGDYNPYLQVIEKLSRKPKEVIKADVDDAFVEIEGHWKIYRIGIKAVITKEEYPEYFL